MYIHLAVCSLGVMSEFEAVFFDHIIQLDYNMNHHHCDTALLRFLLCIIIALGLYGMAGTDGISFL